MPAQVDQNFVCLERETRALDNSFNLKLGRNKLTFRSYRDEVDFCMVIYWIVVWGDSSWFATAICNARDKDDAASRWFADLRNSDQKDFDSRSITRSSVQLWSLEINTSIMVCGGAGMFAESGARKINGGGKSNVVHQCFRKVLAVETVELLAASNVAILRGGSLLGKCCLPYSKLGESLSRQFATCSNTRMTATRSK